MTAYEKARANNVEFLKDTPINLRDYFGQGPRGLFDAYQWMLFLAAHSARHTAQIEEVKSDAHFPKS